MRVSGRLGNVASVKNSGVGENIFFFVFLLIFRCPLAEKFNAKIGSDKCYHEINTADKCHRGDSDVNDTRTKIYFSEHLVKILVIQGSSFLLLNSIVSRLSETER